MYIFLNLNNLYSIYLFIYIIIEQFRFHHFKDLDGVEYMLNNLVFSSLFFNYWTNVYYQNNKRVENLTHIFCQKHNICLRQY